MLVAFINADGANKVVKWQAGSVVLPVPDGGQQITWNANSQQVGQGANKISLDGGTGNVNIPGSVTVGVSGQSGQITGVSVDHAIILRGDTTNPTLNYAIIPGDTCAFIEYGGSGGLRQIQETSNQIRFEITPTHVNIPTSLRVGGYTAGMRPVPGGTGGVYWPRGQNAANCTRRSTGEYTVTWGTVAHPDGSQHVPQYCPLNAFGSICGGTRTSTSVEIRTASDGVGTIADRDFWFTLH